MRDYPKDIHHMLDRFEQLKDFDSMIFVEIPQQSLVQPHDYRQWLVDSIEAQWMKAFNSGNDYYNPRMDFNDESGISGYFGRVYIDHCKLYRYDATLSKYSEHDFRAKRGYLIRDHYSELDVVKVHLIADNLVEFLQGENIKHSRRNFTKRV